MSTPQPDSLRTGLRALVALLALGGVGVARASPAASATASTSAFDLAELRVSGGVSLRSGSQESSDLALRYDGWTPSSVAVDARLWPLLRGSLGLSVGGGREGVGLYDTEQRRVVGGSLVALRVGPAYRVFFGPVAFEARVGYAYDTLLTAAADGAALRFAPVTRHALLAGGRVTLATRYASFELRGENAITLASSSGARSSGLGLGAAVRVPIAAVGAFAFGALAEGGFGEDRLRSDASTAASAVATAYRAGVGLSVSWRDASRASVGRLRVTVVDAESRQPLAGAVVEATTASGSPVLLESDGVGVYVAGDVPAGGVRARARLDGYDSAEGASVLSAQGEAVLSLVLQREAPKTGAVAVRVTDKGTGAPLRDATVRVGGVGAKSTSDSDGRLTLQGLPVGPIALEVEREGYLPLSEAAVVAGGLTSEVALQLLPAKKRLPATLSGRVRSARGGQPIAASLAIPEARISARAQPDGSFSFELPPGSYTVTISAPRFVTQTKRISVNDAEQAIFNVDLTPQ